MAEQPLQPKNRGDFRIAIFCALPLEAGMVRSIFDEEKNNSFGKAPGDTNTYSIGVIGRHNVVLPYLPGIGNMHVPSVASHLLRSFPGIMIAFVVGICGTSPQDCAKEKDIFLGDCIVSTSLIRYDLGRQYPEGFDPKPDASHEPGLMIRGFLTKLQTRQTSNSLEARLASHLSILQQKESEASYPGPHRDRLFDATHIHTHQDATMCDECIENLGVCGKGCDELGCQREGSAARTRPIVHGNSENQYLPKLHFGRYGSANTVLKSGAHRDKLAKSGAIAFEMEGAGCWEYVPTLIVKSACDYADSHKNKEWQDHAAASAACGLKAILEEWDVNDEDPSQVDDHDVSFSLDDIPIAKEFIDRPGEMQKLEAALLPNDQPNRRKLFVLHGLGGIGKTQLAVEFMRKHSTDFTAILWLNGSSEDSLKQSIAKFAGKIPAGQITDTGRMYTDAGKDDISTAIKKVMDWLKLPDNNKWLMVFDNVDRDFNASNPEPLAYNIEIYLPGADHGSILITTRLAGMGKMGKSEEVNKLNKATAKEILNSWCDSHSNTDIDDLLEKLDGLPLALAQAGSYLHQTGITIRDYLRLFDDWNEEAEAIYKSGELNDYSNHNIWTTWNISYNAVLAKDKYAANLLVLWSFLDRSDFWYGLFKEGSLVNSVAEALFDKLGDIVSRESSFIEAIRLLRSYSLIEASGSGKGHIMHAVLHRWVYLYHGVKYRSDLGMLALKVIGFAASDISEHGAAQLQQRLLPHINMCSIRVLDIEKRQYQIDNDIFKSQTSRKGLEDCLDAMSRLGNLFGNQDKLDESEKMYLRVLQEYEAIGSEGVHYTSNSLGLVYQTQGKLDEAEKMFKQALQGSEAFGPGSDYEFVVLINLGNTYDLQGRSREAEKIYMRVLGGPETFGPETLHMLMMKVFANMNLGVLYWHQGKRDEAEKYFIQALSYKKTLGPRNIYVLLTSTAAGHFYCEHGKFGKAQDMYEQALQGYEEIAGTDYLKTYSPAIQTMCGLGFAYSHTQPEKARAMLERALEGCAWKQGESSETCLHIKECLETLNYNLLEKLLHGFKRFFERQRNSLSHM